VCIPNLGALPIIALVYLTHIPCLFACFYESVSCVYVFFSTCRSTCVARAACFVFCSIFLTTFLLSCSFVYKVNRHQCHCAYWCTHNPAHMPILLLHLHLPVSNSCVYVSENVLLHAFPSSSIFIHTYCRIHMYGLCSVLYLWASFCFLPSVFKNLIDTCVTVPVHVRATLLICLSSFSICIFISLIYEQINKSIRWSVKKLIFVPVTLQIHNECSKK